MQEISISKITNYSEEHFNFIVDIYSKNNAKEDLEEGRLTFKQFISVEQTNARIKEGSQLYQVIINSIDRAGIFEIEENHITLLYVKDDFQLKGMGTFCINTIKFLLKNKYNKITVFASPYSVDFYIKNGFAKKLDKVQLIKGMRYYNMELSI